MNREFYCTRLGLVGGLSPPAPPCPHWRQIVLLLLGPETGHLPPTRLISPMRFLTNVPFSCLDQQEQNKTRWRCIFFA